MKYEKYDRLPLVHFGFWSELVKKWADEKRFSRHLLERCYDGSPNEQIIGGMLGFDYNYFTVFKDRSKSILASLYPGFEEKLIETLPDGSQKWLNHCGLIQLRVPGATSIPAEVDWLFKDRATWEELFLPKLQYSPDRIDWDKLEALKAQNETREHVMGLFAGSLFGQIRDMLGIVNVSYLLVDDEDLYDEIIDTVGQLCYDITYAILSSGVKLDFAHYFEDICYNHGPLVNPAVFARKVGPWYKKINNMIRSFGIDIIVVDSDGKIDELLPVWLDNGVNTFFPIEVGTWNASIAPWREKYGKNLRGVGGVNKHVLSQDRAAIDRELERIRALVELGGFIPCLDHRVAPDAEWDLILYYTDRYRTIFG